MQPCNHTDEGGVIVKMNNIIQQCISEEHMHRLNRLAHRLNAMELNVLFFDADCHCVLQSAVGDAEADSDAIGRQLDQQANGWIDDHIYLCPLDLGGGVKIKVVIDSGTGDRLPSAREKQYISHIVNEIVENFVASEAVPLQIEKFSTELSRAYEEIILLYNLSTNMKVTQSNASYLQMACDQLTQLVQVEGIAIFIDRRIDGQRQLALSAGSGVISIDPVQADILQMHLLAELQGGKDALVDSNQDGDFKYQWPETVRNILAVPLGNDERMRGFLVATNVLDKEDFDTTDIKLFTSVANQCLVFIENNRLFDDLKELFIGCLKALTNSIDAKDQYTRGHSERVAFISRWIAEHLAQVRPLSEKQIHNTYLAGLLHDIGKIGITEAVLRKNGRLTDEERAIIQSHPKIGAGILSGIRQMEEVVPGVLGHHERMDGKGYPNGLVGDQIPIIARIISLADAFDAMTSRRVYRDAMNLSKALSIIEGAIGTQFDEEIARVFLNSDIDKLWHIIQDGFIESWDYSNFDEYGVEAVGALVR